MSIIDYDYVFLCVCLCLCLCSGRGQLRGEKFNSMGEIKQCGGN